MQVMFILRNPVHRAWSGIVQTLHREVGAEEFHEYVVRSESHGRHSVCNGIVLRGSAVDAYYCQIPSETPQPQVPIAAVSHGETQMRSCSKQPVCFLVFFCKQQQPTLAARRMPEGEPTVKRINPIRPFFPGTRMQVREIRMIDQCYNQSMSLRDGCTGHSGEHQDDALAACVHAHWSSADKAPWFAKFTELGTNVKQARELGHVAFHPGPR